MSRRGNCHDNAVSESFFANLKKEKIRRIKYKTRDDARQAMFNYIEMFYNPKRRHTHNDRVSPTLYEQRYLMKQKSVLRSQTVSSLTPADVFYGRDQDILEQRQPIKHNTMSMRRTMYYDNRNNLTNLMS